MRQIFHIVRYKFLAFIRPESKITFGYILKNLGSGSIYLAFAVGAFLFSNALIKFLLINVKVGHFLLHEFISMILFIFFISINVGNIIVSYSTLFKSSEVSYLITKPVPTSYIFTIKFLDNFFYSSSTLLMILFSFLAGYAFYFKLGLIQLLLLVINFIPYMISAGALGVIVLLLVIKSADKFGVKRVMYGIIFSYISVIILFFNLNSPKLLVATVMKYYPFIDKDKYLGYLIPPVLKVLPNNWLSQTAYSIIHNDFTTAISFSYLQLSLAVVLFTIAFMLGRKFYYQTWLLNLKLTSEISSKRKSSSASFIGTNEKQSKYWIDVVTQKDILLFFREPSQVIHLSILFFLILIFIISVSGIRYFGMGNFYLQTMIYLAIFIFNLLLITSLSLRFVFPMVSLEGHTFWKIKSSPVSIKEFVYSKLLNMGMLILFISVVLALFSNFKFQLSMFVFALLITVLATFTIIAINFGMGASFANYKEKNPIRISSSQGASLSFLIALIYLLFLVILLFKPFSALFLARMINKDFNLLRLFWYFIPILIVSILGIIFFMRMTFKSLKKDF